MGSLLEALYTYALENRIDVYRLCDEKERQENERMVRLAREELSAQGMDDAVQRMEDGLSTLNCLDLCSAFRAGLSIGLELGRA